VREPLNVYEAEFIDHYAREASLARTLLRGGSMIENVGSTYLFVNAKGECVGEADVVILLAMAGEA